jgi:hypothetical protein
MADDEGRLRGDSVFLRNMIFAYDRDIQAEKIDECLYDLQDHGCIQRYTVDDSDYIRLPKWSIYQKVDHPIPSKLPTLPENWIKNSRKVREDSRETLEASRENAPNRIQCNIIKQNINSESREVFDEPEKEKTASPNTERVEPKIKPVIKKPENNSLHHKIQMYFEKEYGGNLPNYKVEGQQIKNLITRTKGDEQIVKLLLTTFSNLTKIRGDPLYDKPFLPSTLMTTWIYNIVHKKSKESIEPKESIEEKTRRSVEEVMQQKSGGFLS